MKKFAFKLQKLLEIRQKKEDQEKLELAKASSAYQAILQKKDKMLANVRDLRRDLKQDDGRIDLSRLRAYDKLTKDTDLAVKKLEPLIEEKRKIMQQHVEKYTALQRDRKAVEILKDKAYSRYQEEANREEQKELDEIAKNIHLRNKGSRRNPDNQ